MDSSRETGTPGQQADPAGCQSEALLPIGSTGFNAGLGVARNAATITQEVFLLRAAYVLFALGLLTPWIGPIMLVGPTLCMALNRIEGRLSPDEFFDTHHDWLWKTFWYGLGFLVVAHLMLPSDRSMVHLLVFYWVVYRLGRGLYNFVNRARMPKLI